MTIVSLENAANRCKGKDVQVDLASRLGWKRDDSRLEALECLIRAGKRFGAKISYDAHERVLFVQHWTFGVKIQCDSASEISNAAIMLDFADRVLDNAFREMRRSAEAKKPEPQAWGLGLEQMFRERIFGDNCQPPRTHRPPTTLPNSVANE